MGEDRPGWDLLHQCSGKSPLKSSLIYCKRKEPKLMDGHRDSQRSRDKQTGRDFNLSGQVREVCLPPPCPSSPCATSEKPPSGRTSERESVS